MIEQSRRGFITGLISLVAAPAIVRAGSLMPIKGEILGWREVVRSGMADGVMRYTYTVYGIDAFGHFASEEIEWSLMPHTSQTSFREITSIEVGVS